MALVSKILASAIFVATSLLLITYIQSIRAQQVASPAALDDNARSSAILDDLVNQIIEKNRNIFESEASRSPRQAMSSSANLAPEPSTPSQVSLASANGNVDDLLADYQVASQELDDRHIQYDVIHQHPPVLGDASSTSLNQAKSSNYKLASTSNQGSGSVVKEAADSSASDPEADLSEDSAMFSLDKSSSAGSVNHKLFSEAQAATLVKRSDTSSGYEFQMQVKPVVESEKSGNDGQAVAAEGAAGSSLTLPSSTAAPVELEQPTGIEKAISKQEVQSSSSSNTNATARSLHLSARSLQGAGSSSGSSSKVAPSHTRPPYASHDKFHGAGASLPALPDLSGAQLNESSSTLLEVAASSAESQLMHKLAPPAQLVELDPMPAGSGLPGSPSSNEQQQLDRFYFSKERLGGSFSSASGGGIPLVQSSQQQATRGGHNDRYAQQQALELGESAAYNTLAGAPELLQQQVLLARQPSPSSEHRYAASFVNLTGPLLAPLSASEAMESALGGGQAAKSLLAQASGFARPPQLEGATRPAQVVQTLPGGSHLHAYPGPSRHHAHQSAYYLSNSDSLYSAPANQFSTARQPLSGMQGDHLLAADTQAQEQQNNASSERERMRLESHFHLVGRRPTAGFGPPSTSASETHLHLLGSRENLTQQASGFRSPLQSTVDSSSSLREWPSTGLPTSYLSGVSSMLAGSAQAANVAALATTSPTIYNATYMQQQQQQQTRAPATSAPSTSSPMNSLTSSTTNGFITGVGQLATASVLPPSSSQLSGGGSASNLVGGAGAGAGSSASVLTDGPNRRLLNLTRVEHISAECSNDLIRTVIVFNGTFKGIIYSSGYVRDPNCMYINGTGKTRYDFSIRLNQCGTLGRQEVHQPAGPNEVSRQDKVMWNTLSIQYNPIIEQEWDEHFRVSCEYGSDFWKTVSFSPFNVETNTGSPVVFTVDPPQCQMEILRGHGMVGPRQDADSGAVTVGDPLTLLIHMKSEKAGYDILVKNCIAHNGGNQKMQLIDSNGCVVNERFISPFRGTYNDNDLKHVTLYSYLKAFRFTGSPVLYLECEIHMCQSKCPPQMCYWRRLSKRSTNETATTSLLDDIRDHDELDEDHHENYYSPDDSLEAQMRGNYEIDSEFELTSSKDEKSKFKSARTARQLTEREITTTTGASKLHNSMELGQISDKVSLFQALKVLEPPKEPNAAPYSLHSSLYNTSSSAQTGGGGLAGNFIDSSSTASGALKEPALMCYRQAQVLAILLSTCSILLVTLSVALGCCWRMVSSRRSMINHRSTAYSSSSGNSSISARHSLVGVTSSSSSSLISSAASSPSANNKHLSFSHYHKRPTQHQYQHYHQQQPAHAIHHSPYAMPAGSLISIADENQQQVCHSFLHNKRNQQAAGMISVYNSSNQKAPEGATLADSLLIGQHSDRHKKRLLAANH